MPKGIYPHKKGRKFSEEHKRKIGQANAISKLGKKLKPHSKAWNNKIRKSLMGHPVSKEARLKVSIANKGKPKSEGAYKFPKGEKHHSWKGGITPINEKIRRTIEYRLWREAVYARDNWTCQHCYKRGGKLQAHHIKEFADYPELRFAIDNGLTLCCKCHDKTKKGVFNGKGKKEI